MSSPLGFTNTASRPNNFLSTGVPEIGVFQSWTDFAPNLFEAVIFGTDSVTGSNNLAIPQAKFYILNFSVGGAGLDLVRHDLYRQWYAKGYKYPDSVTVKWKEDAALSVWRYHNEWISQFYDRFNDCFVTGHIGKKRNMVIQFQKFDFRQNKNPSLNDLVTTFRFRFIGLVPNSNYNISGGWESSSENTSYDISYNFDYMTYEVVDMTLRELFKGVYS